MNDEKNISIIGHLNELRSRIIWISIVILTLSIIIFIFIVPITNIVLLSMTKSDFITYQVFCKFGQYFNLGDDACMQDLNMKTIETGMTNQFSTSIYFSIIGAIIFSIPFIFYQIWLFVKPALKSNEIKVSRAYVFYSSILFLIGVSFGYFIISPLSVQFFFNYKMSEFIDITPTFSSFYTMIISIVFACALFFQLPIVLFLLAKFGLINAKFLKKYRKHAIVIILVLSAIITPPDILSQIIVSIPIFMLYEVTILIIHLKFDRKLKDV